MEAPDGAVQREREEFLVVLQAEQSGDGASVLSAIFGIPKIGLQAVLRVPHQANHQASGRAPQPNGAVASAREEKRAARSRGERGHISLMSSQSASQGRRIVETGGGIAVDVPEIDLRILAACHEQVLRLHNERR